MKNFKRHIKDAIKELELTAKYESNDQKIVDINNKIVKLQNILNEKS